MIYTIATQENPILNEIYENSMRELGEFFGFFITQNRPKIIIVPDRKTINELMETETEPWLVGWQEKWNIFLLDPMKYEKESNHIYSEEKFTALIKHELCHRFTNILWNGQRPTWLLEGFSIYLSGQLKFYNKPEKYSAFLESFDCGRNGVYEESGFAMEFLIKRHGKEKAIEFLIQTKKAGSPEDIAVSFRSIYGFELCYENIWII